LLFLDNYTRIDIGSKNDQDLLEYNDINLNIKRESKTGND